MKSRFFIFLTAFILGFTGLDAIGFPNDGIFAPKPAAQSYINFDGKGFIINGKRVFVASAGIEYARVPQELWADRLMRLKRAGFNCIETYVFWNYHEALEGQFNFENNRNLDAFLKLANSLGLYAIVRVGPYSCAEWDMGGYPVWLQFKQGLLVRDQNSLFEQYVGNWWNKLLPIVVNNQINRGGNVILVQLENENNAVGWGTDGASTPYYQFMSSNALNNGLEVPYFFSGLHHGSDPAGDIGSPWSSSGRTSPWFSTEFWCDWYNVYGETNSDIISKDRATWKIIAWGGNGYNYYMAHGGSNFDYFNDNEGSASYDYGAAVGESGDLRGEYYKFKKAALFSRSFQSILENSDNASNTYKSAANNSSVAVWARQSSAGTILFLDNNTSSTQQTKVTINGTSFPQSASLTLNSSEIMPVVTNYSLIAGVTLKVAPTRILGILQQSNTTTMVIYGQAGSPAELYFNVPSGTTITTGASALSQDGSGNMTLKTTYPSNNIPVNFSFQTGTQRVRILVVNNTLADNTWFVDAGGNNYVVCGPQYVGNANIVNGNLQINTETTWQNATNYPIVAYDSSDTPQSLTAITSPEAHPGALTLSAWQTMSGIDPAAPGYNTAKWYSSTSGPQSMGADGDVSSYAWYRTTFNAATAGQYTIGFGRVADHMLPFIDGTVVPSGNISNSSFTANLSAGNHTIAVFTSHYGRQKLTVTNTSITQLVAKGILAPASARTQSIGAPIALTNWKIMATNSSAVGSTPPSSDVSGWSSYTLENDPFNGQAGYAWFQTTLPSIGSAKVEVVNFKSVDDNCWIYLNGKQLATNEGWNVPIEVDLSSAWNLSGPNVLSVLVQNTGAAGGVNSPINFTTYASGAILNNWVQQGGPSADPNATTGYQILSDGTAFSGPQFFKTTFTANPPKKTGTYPIWRVTVTGLSRGSIWVNGHNLGRYPQTMPVSGLYIPECWLTAGSNILVVFDENGKRPDQVQIIPETEASHDIEVFAATKHKK